jgi:hypothetical protein
MKQVMGLQKCGYVILITEINMANFDNCLSFIRNKIEEKDTPSIDGSNTFELYDDQRGWKKAAGSIRRICDDLAKELIGRFSGLDINEKIAHETALMFYQILHINKDTELSTEEMSNFIESFNIPLDEGEREDIIRKFQEASKALYKYERYGVGDTMTDESITSFLKKALLSPEATEISDSKVSESPAEDMEDTSHEHGIENQDRMDEFNSIIHDAVYEAIEELVNQGADFETQGEQILASFTDNVMDIMQSYKDPQEEDGDME